MNQRGLMGQVRSPAFSAFSGLVLVVAGTPPVSSPFPVVQAVVRAPKSASPLLEYMRSGAPFKPYVVKLRTPSGINVLRDNVPDHPHHHGLMLACAVDGVNFWEETAESGKQRIEESKDRPNGVRDSLTWISPTQSALLHEERRLDVLPSGDPQATLLSWRSEFSLPKAAPMKLAPSTATISGSHYNGLGMRFVEPMDGGMFINSENNPGVVVRGEERLTTGRWCAYIASVNGKQVTVAMFDHPGNVRPATWFTMPRPFGYMSATLGLHETPLELQAGKQMVLRYGIAVWDGHVDSARIAKVCETWLRRVGK